MHVMYGHLDSCRSQFFHSPLEKREYLLRLQVRRQAQADLGFGSGRNHCLSPFAHEAANDAVYLQRWPRPDTFQWRIFCLTRQLRNAHLFKQHLIGMQWIVLPELPLLGGRLTDVVIESGDMDVAI